MKNKNLYTKSLCTFCYNRRNDEVKNIFRWKKKYTRMKRKIWKEKKIIQCETVSWIETENNINVVCERENETKEYINEFFFCRKMVGKISTSCVVSLYIKCQLLYTVCMYVYEDFWMLSGFVKIYYFLHFLFSFVYDVVTNRPWTQECEFFYLINFINR